MSLNSRHILLTGPCMTRPVFFWLGEAEICSILSQRCASSSIFSLSSSCGCNLQSILPVCPSNSLPGPGMPNNPRRHRSPGCRHFGAVSAFAPVSSVVAVSRFNSWHLLLIPTFQPPCHRRHDGTNKVHPAPLKVKRMTRDPQKYISTTSLLMKTH